ncbi:unnamed protein product [Diamesa serratosioi]
MGCIFCEIANGKTETEILFEDEKLVLFRDIRPAADHHFLVVPREHIINTKSLSVDHKEMLMEMKKHLIEIMRKNGITNINDINLGFHVPPFNSIKHLHMHAIAPKLKITLLGRWIFREDSYWYKTADTIISRLQ